MFLVCAVGKGGKYENLFMNRGFFKAIACGLLQSAEEQQKP